MSRYSKTTLRKGDMKTRGETETSPSSLRLKTGTSGQEEAMLLDDTTACTKESTLVDPG